MMEVIIVEENQQIGEYVAEEVVEMLNNDKIFSIFDAGVNLTTAYQNLRESHNKGLVSFNGQKICQLSEYVDSDANWNFLNDNLIKDVDIKDEDIYRLNKDTINKMNKNMPSINLIILELDENGLVGFNQPGDSFDSILREVDLSEKTREAKKEFFGFVADVPLKGYTFGLSNIMKSDRIILVCAGEKMANSVQDLLEGYEIEEFPASILMRHPNISLVIDEAAARLLEDIEEE